MKDLLLRAPVVVRTSNMKIPRCRLANYVKTLHQKACRTCSTIIFLHSTNQIIDLWRCRWRCRRQILNSLITSTLAWLPKDVFPKCSQGLTLVNRQEPVSPFCRKSCHLYIHFSSYLLLGERSTKLLHLLLLVKRPFQLKCTFLMREEVSRWRGKCQAEDLESGKKNSYYKVSCGVPEAWKLYLVLFS